MASLDKVRLELDQITDSAIRAKSTLESLTQQMMRSPSQTTQMNYMDELNRIIALEQKRILLLKEYNSLVAQRNASLAAYESVTSDSSVTNVVSHPTGQDVGAGGPTRTGVTPEQVAMEQKKARERAIEAARQQAIEAEKQRQIYIRTTAFAREAAYMAERGFTDPKTQFKTTFGVPGSAYRTDTWERMDPVTGGKIRDVARVDSAGNVSKGLIPKANQSFAQGIGKDLGDLMKWSIAIAAIYGPINAASEAMTELIANEVKLATVSIALNEGVANTEKVFIDVNAAARSSGEAISGIIDAFGAAYTATGRITNEYQRYNATVTLLRDSLTLSKLSTLDQAGAIDVLTAALYQVAEAPLPNETSSETAARALSRGTELIDQWIQVSKVASVTVETLATGVAVLGDSAETAGLSIEQMNAMIATLAEVSLSGGKETANIAKALIGNYQQESAVKELNRIGIAVQDTTGKTRQFIDVMKDVASLRSAKILGNEDFSRLTLALGGGGIRRQKDVSAFIENFGRMEQLSGMQGGAGGASAEALSKQLDTVQTSATNMQNSFVNLAQTMGNEGGLLDVMSNTLKVGTFLVDMFDKLAGAVGKAGPLLMAAGVVKMLTLGKDPGYLTSMLANNMMIPMAGMLGNKTPTMTGDMWARKTTGDLPLSGIGGMRGFGLPSALALTMPAIGSLMGGKPEEALGGLAGGIIGALTTAGNPIGILIGNAAGEAMVKAVTYDSSFADFFAGKKKLPEPGLPQAASPDEIGKELFRGVGGLAPVGELVSNIMKGASQFKIFQDAAQKGGGDFGAGFNTPEAFALEMAKKNDPKLYAKAMFEYAKQGALPEGEFSALTRRQVEISGAPGTKLGLEAMQREEMDRLRASLIKGDIKQADYGNRTSSLSAFAVTAPRVMAGMESEIGGVGDAFKSVEDAYKAYLDVASSGNTELITGINAQLVEIDKVRNLLDRWLPEEKKIPITIDINGVPFKGDFYDLQKLLPGMTTGLTNYTAAASKQAQLNNLPLRDVYGGNVAPTSGKDLTTVTQDAIKLQDQYYSNLTKDQYESKKSSFETFYVWVEEAGKMFYKSVLDASGKPLDKAIFGEAFQAAQKAGTIAEGAGNGMDWQVQGATKAQYLDAMNRAPAFAKALENVPGSTYKSKIEDVLVTTSDKQTLVSHGDQKVIQYLLQQILDTEKKQLQGVWNLPEGSSFWVPLQSMLVGGGGYGGGTGTTPGIEEPAKSYKDMLYEQSLRENLNPATMLNNALNKASQPIVGEDGRGIGTRTNPQYQFESPQGPPAPEAGLLSQLINSLKDLFMGMWEPGSGAGGGKGMRGGVGPGYMGGKYMDQVSQPQAASMKFDLKLSSTTQLVVDGRTLASIVKPYLAADFLRANESGGTITRAYVL
jgi:TP901 family phage tail tape measure protein